MKINWIIIIIFSLVATAKAQVGIGTITPNNAAALDITSTNKGILIPKINIISLNNTNPVVAPATGLLVYNINTSLGEGFYYWNGIQWTSFSGTSWSIFGNGGTNTILNHLGTNDNQSLVIKTNNTRSLELYPTQKVGIGNTIAPTTTLKIGESSNIGKIRLEDGRQSSGRILVSDANGNAQWEDASVISNPDDDWRFHIGSLNSDNIYRTGQTFIGLRPHTAGSSRNSSLLDIYNDEIQGTVIGLGSDEYVVDDTNLFQFSHNFVPSQDNSYQIGQSGLEWLRLFSVNGVIQTSDLNDKEFIEPLNYGIVTLNKLKPISYYWKNEKYGNTNVPNYLKKKKIGFNANNLLNVVPEVVYNENWIPVINSNNEVDYELQSTNKSGVNYAELLPIITKSIQEHEVELNAIISKQNQIKSILQNK